MLNTIIDNIPVKTYYWDNHKYGCLVSRVYPGAMIGNNIELFLYDTILYLRGLITESEHVNIKKVDTPHHLIHNCNEIKIQLVERFTEKNSPLILISVSL